VNLVGSEKGSESKRGVTLCVDPLLVPTLLTAHIMVLGNEQKQLV